MADKDESGMFPDLEHLFFWRKKKFEKEVEKDIEQHIDPLAKEEEIVQEYMRKERGD